MGAACRICSVLILDNTGPSCPKCGLVQRLFPLDILAPPPSYELWAWHIKTNTSPGRDFLSTGSFRDYQQPPWSEWHGKQQAPVATMSRVVLALFSALDVFKVNMEEKKTLKQKVAKWREYETKATLKTLENPWCRGMGRMLGGNSGDTYNTDTNKGTTNL